MRTVQRRDLLRTAHAHSELGRAVRALQLVRCERFSTVQFHLV